MEAPTKHYTPTYLSVPKLERMLALLSSRNFSKITAKTFLPEHFSPSDAALAVACAKFLRLIDDKNAATDLMAKLHLKGDARKHEFEHIVRAAYRELFEVVEKPYELSQDDLSNEMLRSYKLTPRIVRAAAVAFLKLCEYAGLREEGSIMVKARAPRRVSAPRERAAPAPRLKVRKPRTGERYSFPIVAGKLYIEIDAGVHDRSFIDDGLGEDLRDLIKAAHRFAQLHFTDD